MIASGSAGSDCGASVEGEVAEGDDFEVVGCEVVHVSVEVLLLGAYPTVRGIGCAVELEDSDAAIAGLIGGADEIFERPLGPRVTG